MVMSFSVTVLFAKFETREERKALNWAFFIANQRNTGIRREIPVLMAGAAGLRTG